MFLIYLLRKKLEDTLLSDKAELRKRTQIALSTVSKMENNEHLFLDVLARIAIVLECGLDDVVEMKNDL